MEVRSDGIGHLEYEAGERGSAAVRLNYVVVPESMHPSEVYAILVDTAERRVAANNDAVERELTEFNDWNDESKVLLFLYSGGDTPSGVHLFSRKGQAVLVLSLLPVVPTTSALRYREIPKLDALLSMTPEL